MNPVADGVRALARVGGSVRDVARVFRADASERQSLEHGAHRAALDQMGAEFAHPRRGWFDAGVDALNRLPRPLLAFGTIGLFVFAMVDPPRFAGRMEGLAYVPEPLWWLLGAIVGFYFGARELHHRRVVPPRPEPRLASWHHEDGAPTPPSAAPAGAAAMPEAANDNVVAVSGDNAALTAWRARRAG